MILIITETSDNSTDDVIEWIHAFGKHVIRVNIEDKVRIKLVKYNGKVPAVTFILNNGEVINSDGITSYWYRRGDIKLLGTENYDANIRNTVLKGIVSKNLRNEVITIRDLLYYILQNKPVSIGNYFLSGNNKLIHISAARQAGLETPESIVCTEKKGLILFYNRFPSGIITKPISNGIGFFPKRNKKDNSVFAIYTSLLTGNDIEKIPTTFFPTLLQEKIDKKFELRIFYLKGRFYPMAIFSQNDDQTKIDFRRYNHKYPNRRVPYTLAPSLKKKLKKLMMDINLDTGSIDMIYSADNKYYFLEVNPVGQFGMVSYPCNYKLEKQIAIQLLKNGR